MTNGEPVGPNPFTEERRKTQNELLRLSRRAELFMRGISGNVDYEDGFEGIAVQELTQLGRDMLESPGFLEAYGMLARYPRRGGKCFYDRLVGGPELMDMYKSTDLVMKDNETSRVPRGLDIATGSGMGAIILSQYVDHVVATDLSEPLLEVAHSKLADFLGNGSPKYARSFETRQMDALDPIFEENEAFDIVTSIGISNFLTREEREIYYRGVNRILKPGGRYYEPQATAWTQVARSDRGALALMVAGIPSDLNAERLQGRNTRGFPVLEELGFEKFPVRKYYPNVYVLGMTKASEPSS